MVVLLSVLLVLSAAAIAALALRLRRARRDTLRLRGRVRSLEKDAARADVAKRRFLTSVTHELRTPLTAILGYQELIADGLYGEIDDRFRRPIERIGNAAEHLLQLIDGVLELARLDTGTVELELGPVDTGELISRTAEDARRAAEERGVALTTRIPGRLPRVTTDAERLRRALGLAMLAAVRASPDRTLDVSARHEGDTITVHVTGTGLAMDEYSPERVFGGFDGAPEGEETVSRTGLRLSIARRLARALGGDVSLEPDGAGTTLHFHITDAPALVKASTGR